MHLSDEYDAYCLDEACAYIMSELDSGKTFYTEKKKKHFRSASEMYQNLTEEVR